VAFHQRETRFRRERLTRYAERSLHAGILSAQIVVASQGRADIANFRLARPIAGAVRRPARGKRHIFNDR
jgi:hypothetical protein